MGRLFWKIFLGFWLTILVVGSITGSLVWWHNKERIEELEILVDSPRAEFGINSIADILRYSGEDAVHKIMQRRLDHHKRPFPVFIVDDENQDLFNRPVPGEAIHQAREKLEEHQEDDEEHPSSVAYVRSPSGKRYLLFIPGRDIRPAGTGALLDRRMLILSLLLTFIASTIFSATLAWHLTRPIRFLRKATNCFAEGRLDERVMHRIGNRKDEIADLGKDFDLMAERIQTLINGHRELLNDVSHELRSPLARLQVAIELSRQQPERTQELLARVEKESERLNELVGELLTLSRLETRVASERFDHFDLDGLLVQIVRDANFEAAQQEKNVRYKHNSEALIYGDIELIRRALENIVRNAVFHTLEKSEVLITLSSDGTNIMLSVCDQGPGVPEDQLENVFRPFVRIDKHTQNIKIPGYGLGMAIAKRAIELHGGTISAANQGTGGLCVSIQLPIKDTAQPQ